jgi:hypothetical protein
MRLFPLVTLGLSPEHVYPVAMNEVIASYKSLIQEHGVDPKKIVLRTIFFKSYFVRCKASGIPWV